MFVADSYAQLDFRRVCVHKNGNDIELSWAQPSNPCGKFVDIKIFARLNNTVSYTFIDSVTNINQLNFVHTNAATLGTTWSYYLVFNYLCDNSSYQTTIFSIDFNQPNTTNIDSVSYDPLSKFWTIGWSGNPAPDLLGYIVWSSQGNNNIPLDSLRALYYIDSSSNPNNSASSYRLSAYDSCVNQSVISDFHKPMYLSLSSNSCGTKNTLTWNAYEGLTNSKYEIYSKKGSSDYALDTTLFPPNTNLDFTLNSGDSIEYYVRVFLGNGATSRSNPVKITATDLYQVDSNYITQVSWTSPNTFEITCLHPISELWDSVYIKRSFNKSNISIYGKEIQSSPLIITDRMPDTNLYYYQQILIDNCGRSYNSTTHSNILLESTEPNTDSYNLNWNNYINWLNGVKDYQINLGDDISQYSTWNNLRTVYPDTNESIIINDDNLNIRCFQIKATENGANIFNQKGVSYSNPVCHIQKPSIYFPNAFLPNGINKTYSPVGISIDQNKSTIQIYSRTGQRVWDSNLTKQWTGYSTDGKPYQDASFLYYAVIYFLNGDKQIYKGNITVLY